MKFVLANIVLLYVSIFWYSIDADKFQCGITDGDIVGDLRTQVPWMAVIFRKNAATCNWEYWKTGSLIGPSTIIMSGRHFWNMSTTGGINALFSFRASDFLVGFGLVSEDFRDADFYSHYFKVDFITPHAKSEQKYSAYDLALLHLKTAVKFTPYVRALCLGGTSFNDPTSPFTSIVNSSSLKAGFSTDGGFQRLYKNPVVLGNYPLNSTCSNELKRKTSLKQISHGDLAEKKCFNLDMGLAFNQLGRWYLASVAVGGLNPDNKSFEEWYFFSPLDHDLLSWVEKSMQCGPGNTECYKKQCTTNCNTLSDCVPSADAIDNWCTSCGETGMLLSEPIPTSEYVFSTLPQTTPKTIELTTEMVQSVPTNVGRSSIQITKSPIASPIVSTNNPKTLSTSNPILLPPLTTPTSNLVNPPSLVPSDDRKYLLEQIHKLYDTCKMLDLFQLNFSICRSVNENFEKALKIVRRS